MMLIIKNITRVVGVYFGIPLADLLGAQRKAEMVRARHIAMYLCRVHLKETTTEVIGRYFSRDHASILYAVEKVQTQKFRDKEMETDLENLANILNSNRDEVDGLCRDVVMLRDKLRTAKARVALLLKDVELIEGQIQLLNGPKFEEDGTGGLTR